MRTVAFWLVNGRPYDLRRRTMALLITEVEVLTQISHAVRLTGAKLHIQDHDWLSVSELVELIHHADSQAGKLLDRYIRAYRNWYAFHVEAEKVGKQGLLDSDESAELANRVSSRNNTRKELADYVNGLP